MKWKNMQTWNIIETNGIYTRRLLDVFQTNLDVHTTTVTQQLAFASPIGWARISGFAARRQARRDHNTVSSVSRDWRIRSSREHHSTSSSIVTTPSLLVSICCKWRETWSVVKFIARKAYFYGKVGLKQRFIFVLKCTNFRKFGYMGQATSIVWLMQIDDFDITVDLFDFFKIHFTFRKTYKIWPS